MAVANEHIRNKVYQIPFTFGPVCPYSRIPWTSTLHKNSPYISPFLFVTTHLIHIYYITKRKIQDHPNQKKGDRNSLGCTRWTHTIACWAIAIRDVIQVLGSLCLGIGALTIHSVLIRRIIRAGLVINPLLHSCYPRDIWAHPNLASVGSLLQLGLGASSVVGCMTCTANWSSRLILRTEDYLWGRLQIIFLIMQISHSRWTHESTLSQIACSRKSQCLVS